METKKKGEEQIDPIAGEEIPVVLAQEKPFVLKFEDIVVKGTYQVNDS